MKALNVFDEYRNNPSFNVVKSSLGYFSLPPNMKDFFRSFIFLMDSNQDYYFYGEHHLCSKFIVKFYNNEMRTVKLKDFKDVKVQRSIVGSYTVTNGKQIRINYDSDEKFLVEKLERLLEINAKLFERCLAMKELIIYCDNVDAIPSNPVSMIIANEIEIFTGYTVKILTCPDFNVTLTPSHEHVVNNGSFVVNSDSIHDNLFNYEIFR